MERRLYRSKTNRRVGGVCGGLGEYLDVDPTLIRLIFLILIIFTGVVPGLVFYLAAWVVMPEETEGRAPHGDEGEGSSGGVSEEGST